jgi:hypothetical protein
MAGGWGNEWYFGYKHAHSDLSLEDFRSRDRWWDYCRHALEFFTTYEIPFWEMSCKDGLLRDAGGYCLCKPGEIYVAYLKGGGNARLDLSGAKGVFEVQWFDPRHGGTLLTGTVRAVPGGAVRALGDPPKDIGQDWAALIRPADPNRNYPPAVDAGGDQSAMLPREGNSVAVRLNGTVTDDGKPGAAVGAKWSKKGGSGSVRFGDAERAETSATLTGQGVYVLELAANDGERSAADTVTITVEPFSARVTKTYSPSEDAYVEGNAGHDNQQLKVEHKRRTSYLKFDVNGLPPKVLRATLKLTENGDTGGGTVQVHRGSHGDWSETNLTPATAPALGELVCEKTVSVGAGETIEVDVTPLVTGNGTYTVVLTMQKGGNDVWFGSGNSSRPPQLSVTAEDPDTR